MAGESRGLAAYVDTSVLLAAMAPDERHHASALRWIRRQKGGLVTSVLAEVELRRALSRRDAPAALHLVAKQMLEGCELIDVSPVIRAKAIAVRPGIVRSLDAIHIATALVAGLRDFATFDLRQRVGAEEMGLVGVPK